ENCSFSSIVRRTEPQPPHEEANSMGKLRVLSAEGDTQHSWNLAEVEAGDAEAEAAVREAERIFKAARRAGSTAIRVTQGQAPVRIDRFDQTAEQIILVPRIVGG